MGVIRIKSGPTEVLVGVIRINWGPSLSRALLLGWGLGFVK